MIRKYILTLAALIIPIAVVAIVPATPALALFEDSKQQACDGANLSEAGSDCSDDAQGADKIQETIQAVVDILTAIIGVIAVILIIINGLKFITAAGDSNSITAARNGIIYAIVGLIVVALAQIIVRFVLGRVVN